MQSTDDFIESIVDGGSVKVPLFTIGHDDMVEGHAGRVTHEVATLMYSEFDGALARHLYATSNLVFPSVEIVTSFFAKGDGKRVARSRGLYATVVEALAQVGDYATRDRREVDLAVDAAGDDDGNGTPSMRLSRDHFESMRRTLAVIRAIGDPMFCRVSGDLDGVTVFLPGDGDQVYFEIDYRQALITMPPLDATLSQSLKVALYAFDQTRRENAAVRGRARMVRERVMAARRLAVDTFGHMAERQITEFDASMRDKSFAGFRQEIALELVSRLKLAFGDDLRGLSPHARLLAYDWTDGDDFRARPGFSDPRVTAAAQ